MIDGLRVEASREAPRAEPQAASRTSAACCGHVYSLRIRSPSPLEQSSGRRCGEDLRRCDEGWPAARARRIVLRLHVEAGLSLAEVARSLGEEQKALYRKRDALLKRLRVDLEAEGIRCGDAHELLSTLDWDSALTTDVAASASFVQESGSGPSPRWADRPGEGEP